ncbi:hypothetical protein [Tabrizicola aquatica]|uniref:hypothetical protein n=1 Tax=Tabrizicola aquatica TaxID=909926 RepID=UPI0015E1B461|nr:hypothetical protein [Tabrizicola aquatica]
MQTGKRCETLNGGKEGGPGGFGQPFGIGQLVVEGGDVARKDGRLQTRHRNVKGQIGQVGMQGGDPLGLVQKARATAVIAQLIGGLDGIGQNGEPFQVRVGLARIGFPSFGKGIAGRGQRAKPFKHHGPQVQPANPFIVTCPGHLLPWRFVQIGWAR